MIKSNFEFLKNRWPMLAQLGKLGERNIYDDSNTTLYKLGLFGELIVKYMLAYDKIDEPSERNTHANRIKLLKREDLLPQDIDDILYALRIKRNVAAHDAYESINEAKTLTSLAHKLGVWFMQTYGDWDYKAEKFVMPDKNTGSEEVEKLKQEKEILSKEYEEKYLQIKSELEKLKEVQIDEQIKERREQSRKAAAMIELNEAETRKIIDEQLRKSGWEADSQNLKYSKGTRPQKGKNLAIAEWPTDAVGSRNRGRADYALFIGLELVGIIEAKKGSRDIPSDIQQCKDYAKNIKDEHSEYLKGRWNDYKAPFLFATNGRKYLKQLETKSGIWFLDARKNTNHPKALQGWYTPEGLKKLLQVDLDKANEDLKNDSFDYLIDSSGLGLRYYQVKAIKAAEEAIEKGQMNILLSMATGTGKTRTVLGLIYRLIKSKRFRRILFLVDRTSLGIQAEDTFKDVKIEDLMTFDDMYNIDGLDCKKPEIETKIHISTVQGMVKRIMYSNNEENMPTVDDYDCIVIDEAHRGYILDKEMDEKELLFRNQNDYVSKYRMVLEYFDAVKIALTATPALHTTVIFGKPVFQYGYREAVIDGYLVDHEPPHNLATKLKKEKIKYKKGDVVPIYDPVTGEIKNSDELPDDLEFDIDSFNKKVIVQSFNRVVLEEIANYIDPEGEEKTLIFAANDNHADLIVKILKEIFDERCGGIDDEAIMKITGSIKDPQETIKRFKNENFPNIAVTVDLLTTGVDVPKICNIVFLRRIKSRILYEQMLGRATRLCREINKTHFNIFDAVDVYEALKPVTNMKPVVANNKVSFKMLVDEIEQLNSAEEKKNHVNKIVAKLQRKKRRLDKKELEHFKSLTGGSTPDEFIEKVKMSEPEDVIKEFQENTALVNFLDIKKYVGEKLFISDYDDELREHTRGYGNAQEPEDYLKEFEEFLNTNMNKIAALELVCTKPKDLTREALKNLKLELDRNGFNETKLNTAWKSMSNEDIAADIISFIRQQTLGSALISHEERIKKAVEKVKKNHDFSKIEEKWLDRFEKYLMNESIINKDTFENGAFKSKGGYDKINKAFRGKLEDIIQEINDNLYDERGTA